MTFKRTVLTATALTIGLAFSPLQTPITGVQSAEAKLFCSNNGKRFNEWKKAFKKEYAGKYKKSTLAKLDGIKYDTSVIKLDRNNKKSFKGTFESFYKRRSKGVAPIARKKWKQYKKYFDRAESRYGVPAELILSIWGLETAFGRYSGNKNILQSTATLAYDCRRSESLFFPEMLAAMEVIDRGLIDLSKRKGAWAGEIGQTQFLPRRFLEGAVDFDGGGVDVFRSPPDVIGSTARWFAVKGWRRGQDYGEGTSNYRIIMEWNRATNYQRTIPRLAKEIKG
ncbi:MAG: lytic murein transglycosylase [Pseudomonadota bacterium]